MKQPRSVLFHAFGMVRKHIRGYALLSVTIVLSFSLLLGYLVYTDTSLYNEYKELLAMRPGDVRVDYGTLDSGKTALFERQLSKMEGTVYYSVYFGSFGHDLVEYAADTDGDGESDSIQMCNLWAYFLPDYAWLHGLDLLLYPSSGNIVWTAEPREAFTLAADEVILGEKIYFALGMDRQAEPIFHLHSTRGPTLSLRVAGYSKSQTGYDYADEDEWLYTPPMLLSTKLIARENLTQVSGEGAESPVAHAKAVIIDTAEPEKVVQLAETMGFPYISSIHLQQREALAVIRQEKGNKALIAGAMLLLLGINLYSSFSNALNERKFEIGVKRAIGASAWSIVRQFLYEGIIVMAANILISVVLVTDLCAAAKFLLERIPDAYGTFHQWTVYVSPHSAGMFCVCAVALTAVFSLVFAYQSTQVEIVRYLKAE